MRNFVPSAVITLTIVFVLLKLVRVIEWSWWLVLLPAWGGALLLVVFLMVWMANETS